MLFHQLWLQRIAGIVVGEVYIFSFVTNRHQNPVDGTSLYNAFAS